MLHSFWIRALWGPMKSSVTKRNIVIDGHKTSVSLEDAFWNALKEIAYTRQTTLSELVGRNSCRDAFERGVKASEARWRNKG